MSLNAQLRLDVFESDRPEPNDESSDFIDAMPSAVLMDRPPASKVMPLPTRATVVVERRVVAGS